MLVNSPDTTALFFNTSFAELSQPASDNPVGSCKSLEYPAEFQECWAKEWISTPIPIERINAQVLDAILSNECTKNTLSAYNARLISQCLSDKKYDLLVISQLLELGELEIDNGHEYTGLIDHLIQELLNDGRDLLDSLRCLKALSMKSDLKAMIKKHSRINKLYKKLTNMLKHDDDNAVRYALYLLISFLSETSLGKKLFNESSIMEAFALLFSTPALHTETAQKDPIFKDLLGLMLDNRDYSLIFEKFAAENWKNELKWCGSKSLDAIIACAELLKRNILEDLVMKSMEMYEFYDMAIFYLVKHYSDDSLEFINIFLERCTGYTWCSNYLKLVFSITKQFRTSDPFLNLYLHLNQGFLPLKKDISLQITAKKNFLNDLKENGPFPPCFTCVFEELQSLKDTNLEIFKRIKEKLYSNSKDTVLSALIEIQSTDKFNLESLAEYLKNMDSSTNQDSSLDKKIDELDKQLMNAVEESKKYLVIKDELMNAKMEILKQKTRATEVENKNMMEKYDLDITNLKGENTKLADSLRSLSVEYEKMKNSFASQDKTIEALSKQNDEKAQIVKDLQDKILELEESIGEQEEEHQEMVAKLAQSLDSLANRKTRFTSKKTTPVPQETVESLGRNLESTRI